MIFRHDKIDKLTIFCLLHLKVIILENFLVSLKKSITSWDFATFTKLPKCPKTLLQGKQSKVKELKERNIVMQPLKLP